MFFKLRHEIYQLSQSSKPLRQKDINLWRNNLTILVPKVNIVMFFISRNLKDIHVVLEIFDFELNYFCAHNEGN